MKIKGVDCHKLYEEVVKGKPTSFFPVKITIEVDRFHNFQKFKVGQVVNVADFGRDYIYYNEKNQASFIPKYSCEVV